MEIHTLPGMGFSGNIFLVDAERPVLVDTGWSADIGYAAAALEEILAGRSLEHIVLTHRHIDHVGGARAFQERFGGSILAHEEDAEALRQGDRHTTGAVLFGGRIEPLDVTGLKEGARIDLGGGEHMEVLHTPGHTVGSMCLLAGDALLSGDTVFADGGVGRWDLATGDYSQLLDSLRRLAGLDVQRLYPGHGPVVESEADWHISMSLRHLEMYGRYG